MWASPKVPSPSGGTFPAGSSRPFPKQGEGHLKVQESPREWGSRDCRERAWLEGVRSTHNFRLSGQGRSIPAGRAEGSSLLLALLGPCA